MPHRLGLQGKQYIVIVAGGRKYLRSKPGNFVIGFTLDD